MLLLDNIIFSLQKNGGISVYWSELIKKLQNEKIPFTYLDGSKEKEQNISFKNINLDPKFKLNSIRFFLFVKRYLPIYNSTIKNGVVFHSSYYRTINKRLKNKKGIKEVVTVHDFTYEKFSKGLKKTVHVYQKKKSIKSADLIICISNNTKNDLVNLYPEFINKDIRVVYNGVATDYYKINKSNFIFENYFLYVGSRAEYKNFDFVVYSIKKIKNFKLIIVGNILTKSEIEFLNTNLFNQWEYKSNVTNSDLNRLYNNAFALFYPSSYEGFGIPIVEAMRSGCPFIALNTSSIPEIVPEVDFLMNDLNFNEFEKVVKLIKEKRQLVIELGLEKSNDFSWEKCFSEVIEIYKEIN